MISSTVRQPEHCTQEQGLHILFSLHYLLHWSSLIYIPGRAGEKDIELSRRMYLFSLQTETSFWKLLDHIFFFLNKEDCTFLYGKVNQKKLAYQDQCVRVGHWRKIRETQNEDNDSSRMWENAWGLVVIPICALNHLRLLKRQAFHNISMWQNLTWLCSETLKYLFIYLFSYYLLKILGLGLSQEC